MSVGDSDASVTRRVRARAVQAGLLLVGLTALVALPPGAGASPVVRIWFCLDEQATIAGTPGADRIIGTRGRDVIFGRGGDDVILGNDGNDVICGGAGDDDLDGRYGDDEIHASGGADEVAGGPGNDLLVGAGGRDRMLGGDGDAGGDTLIGGRGDDWLVGGDGASDSDHLFGGEGDDSLDGGLSGDDFLYGGAGDDSLGGGTVSFEFSPAGVTADLLLETPGANAQGDGVDRLWQVEALVGSDYDDVLTGDAGVRTLRGRGGDDTISGGGGADLVDGGPGSDRLEGGDGIDRLTFHDLPSGVVASLRDGRAEGAGTDALGGFEQMEGSFFEDELTGDDGPNFIQGSYGANTVFGLGGDDHIWLAAGGDAGDGSDECMNAFAVSACERQGHFDWFPHPAVEAPVHGAELDWLTAVRGSGFYDDRVLAFVRRTTPAGCWWWDAARQLFVRDVCGVLHANVVPVRQGRWSLPLDVGLSPGVYLVGASWPGSHGRIECSSAIDPKCVELDVD